MSLADRIVQQARESKQRKDAALAAVLALPLEQRREVLAELITRAEAEETTSTAPKVVAGQAGTPWESGSFTDKAEAFVLAHPKGVSTRQVSGAIGQDVSSVDGSLRNASKRGRISRQGRLWAPVPFEEGGLPATDKLTIRDKINQVFGSNGNAPLGAAALTSAIHALYPDINRSSVDGEMNRMRNANLLLQVGVGPNGGGIYKLTEEADKPQP